MGWIAFIEPLLIPYFFRANRLSGGSCRSLMFSKCAFYRQGAPIGA